MIVEQQKVFPYINIIIAIEKFVELKTKEKQ